MHYYVKVRKAGTLKTRALREEGRVLVFTNPDAAKKAVPTGYVGMIEAFCEHPRNKASPISGRPYTVK